MKGLLNFVLGIDVVLLLVIDDGFCFFMIGILFSF